LRERLTASPSEAIIKHLIGPRLFGNLDSDFASMDRVNRAHVVMMIETGVVSPETGRRLIEGLERVAAAGVSAIDLDPAKEDLYFNLEAALIDAIGPEAGGQLHTGRSRNDLYATIHRMKARGYGLAMAESALDLIEDLLAKAEAERATVMTGYTHMQPGQPITAGHYLTGVAEALTRDVARLIEGYGRLNLSPLGAAALATTTYPIDRARTADLLGFDGLVENSLDAVASRDYVADLIFAYAMIATTVGRFCTDLHIWYTPEFGFIEIGDEIAGTSSIMPQKKNPSPIEHLKAKAAHHYGALMTYFAAQRGAAFTHGREVGTESVGSFNEAQKQMEAVLDLASAVVRSLQFRKATLLDRVSSNYSTLTELADVYVSRYGITFRVAHQIVGTLAREAVARGLSGAKAIDKALADEIAETVLGRALPISEADLVEALDPSRSVERRRVRGGPSEASVLAMIEEQRGFVARQREVLEKRRQRLAAADDRLAETVSAHRMAKAS
jgi:argininosuccinate lyase